MANLKITIASQAKNIHKYKSLKITHCGLNMLHQ
jgi:hypothetical protein